MNRYLHRTKPVEILALAFATLLSFNSVAKAKAVISRTPKASTPTAASKPKAGQTKKVTGAPGLATNSREKTRTRTQPETKDKTTAKTTPQTSKRSSTYQRLNNGDSVRDDVQAMIAKDDLSGEDPEVRRVAITALGNRAGTVVVMDPRTGRIYSMVNQQWALHEGFKPCSTIKLVTGLAALEEKVIDSDDSSDGSGVNAGLSRALAYSRNDYFQQAGTQVGFDALLSYARKFGLGEKTGINMRNEFAGQLPDGTARSGIARISSHGDHFQVTALQLATLVSAIGNGGKLLTPYVVRSKQELAKSRTRVRRQIHLDSSAWQNMLPGMVGAVSYGSGNKAYDPRQTVAGKTGTCIEDGEWVGLFTSFAPLSNPRVSVVVITRGADAHNHVPAAVAGQIYRNLDTRFGRPGNTQVATNGNASTRKHGEENNQFSEEDRNAMGNRTQLTGQRRQISKVKPEPVLIEVRQKQPMTTAENSGPTGQTRPRRVSDN